jgi:hypothetical protein
MGLFAGQLDGTPGGRTVVVGAGEVVAGAVVAGAVVVGMAKVGAVVGEVAGAFAGFDDPGTLGAGCVPDGEVPTGSDVVSVAGPSREAAGCAAGWAAWPSESLAGAPLVVPGPAALPLPVPVRAPGFRNACPGAAAAAAAISVASATVASTDPSATVGVVVVTTTTMSSTVWNCFTTIGSAWTACGAAEPPKPKIDTPPTAA